MKINPEKKVYTRIIDVDFKTKCGKSVSFRAVQTNLKKDEIMENKNWFVHVEWVVVLVTLLGGFYLIDGKIERQGERTDRLYEMFVQNLNELKNLHGRICIVETIQENQGRK